LPSTTISRRFSSQSMICLFKENETSFALRQPHGFR
jgi:hypothetical protein